jgi:hypothetical protein
MNNLRRAAISGLLLSLCALPALAFNPSCFCTRKNPDTTSLQVYQVVRYAGAKCEREKYESHGLAPWDNGLTACTTSGSPAPKVTDANIRRCYCARHLGGTGIQQYRVYGMDLPECKGVSYKENGVPAYERVLNCDAWSSCYKADNQCQAKMKQLTANITANPANAVRSSAALQAQMTKCDSITNDCYVKGLK